MRLSHDTLDALAPAVARPAYQPGAQRAGIVHLGLGAFTRAHQAVYTDDAIASGDRDWRITGVSLRSPDAASQLNPQNGLFTVTQKGAAGSATRLIGSVERVLVAPSDPDAVVAALAAVGTRIVTLTVTEKAYAARADGALDIEQVDIAAELAGGAPRTIYGYLAQGLGRRRAAGLGGLTLLSCDNMASNGARLAALLDAYLEATDPALGAWVRQHCTCPSTMVDRIVPATRGDNLDETEAALGLRDEAAVFTEPFRQWVIEDRFAGARPRWEAGGAQFVADVHPYEAAKLRMLNGAHSALAYLGLQHGHDFVHQAVADPVIRPAVERLMRVEAAATLPAADGLDPQGYATALLDRFANNALPHRLAQIAMDGSKKIPQRWLEPLAANLAAGREAPATLAALAAWLRFVRGDQGQPVDDPMADRLAALWGAAGEDGIAAAVVGENGLFASLCTLDGRRLAMLTGMVKAGMSR